MIGNFIQKRRLGFIICLFLAASSLLVYYQSTQHDFVNYDDEFYVTENPDVNVGVTLQGIAWAFTTGHGANWHPLTWLSHMLDSELYGLNPMGHHWTNLQLHIANTILLFLFLKWVTGALWRSSLVAAFFALHPLHVESVAWVAERKDVLCAFFWILSMWAYAGYVFYGNRKYYVLLVIFFVLGLMSKPMIVTLPFVLLLLDFWPLSRFQSKDDKFQIPGIQTVVKLIPEKIPLFILSAVSCVVTFLVQKHGGAVTSIDALPLSARIANAVVSYIRYMGKMMFPVNLSIFYPQQKWPLAQVLLSGLLLLGLSALVLRMSRKFSYMATGWFWYLGTLVPVIGIVQVGSQSMADRYTYIPLIGLFIIVAWGLSDISVKTHGRRIASAVFSGVTLIFFMISSWIQVRHWQNGITLFRHAIEATHNNSMAHCELAHALYKHGKDTESVEHFNLAIQLNPRFSVAHDNLGVVLARIGNLEKAIYHHNQALRMDPENFHAYNNLGNALAQKGDVQKAIYHFKKALEIKPDYAGAYYNLGKISANLGKIDQAIHYYQNALHYKPNMEQALYNLSLIFACNEDKKFRNGPEAVRMAKRLCKITRYNQPLPLDALAAAYAETKEFDKAVITAQKALKTALSYGFGDLSSELKQRLELYKTGHSCRKSLRGNV
jgi:cytochrome c-type biogenesis protein CcmH/NrfG